MHCEPLPLCYTKRVHVVLHIHGNSCVASFPKVSIIVEKRTFSSGSMFDWRSLETGSSPDGTVLLVLSMYMGLEVEIKSGNSRVSFN